MTCLSPKNAYGKPLSLIGRITDCQIKFLNGTIQTTIYISANPTYNLFGNDLMEKFNLCDEPINTYSREEITLK